MFLLSLADTIRILAKLPDLSSGLSAPDVINQQIDSYSAQVTSGISHHYDGRAGAGSGKNFLSKIACRLPPHIFGKEAEQSRQLFTVQMLQYLRRARARARHW